MIHNGTSLAARVLIEFVLGRSTQILACIHMLEADGRFARPVFTSTLHNPIVTPVSVRISSSVTRNFLLSTERTL